MKVLLISPPSDHEVTTQVAQFSSGETSYQAPLGLLYIAAVLQRNGYPDVQVVDCAPMRITYDRLRTILAAEAPDVVGITATTFTMIDVMKAADACKEALPKAIVVLGGPHVDIYPRETIALDGVDFCIRGEGELPFLELVRVLDGAPNGKRLETVRNLVWKRGSEVVLNDLRTEPNDYDSLPYPARELIEKDLYFSMMTDHNPVATMITAKGCPYRCVFCYRNMEYVKQRSAKHVVDEMEAILALGYREVFFVDDTFYVNPKRAMAICDEMISRRQRFLWGARARVNNVSDDMLERFAKAGCLRLHIGVEAGNDAILRNLNKKTTVEMAHRAFRMCKKHRIKTLAYFIIGNPGETIDHINQSIRLAKDLEPDFVQFSRMTPFPATALYERGIRDGILSHDYWGEFARDPRKGVVPEAWCEHFSGEELGALAAGATHQFYVRPKYVLKTALGLRSWQDLRRKARTGLRLILGKRDPAVSRLKMV